MDETIASDEPTPSDHIPICAIGASAGGVAAIRGLFRQLPDDLGLAYVVILHLAPDHPSAMAEILSSCTEMPVHQVDDAPRLTPNCVYVIPPDRELVIEGASVTARAFSESRRKRARRVHEARRLSSDLPGLRATDVEHIPREAWGPYRRCHTSRSLFRFFRREEPALRGGQC
ncbi:MAG: chemotaxis protein CheB [Bauldia litoralis]